jgi:hypothetical protein
MVILTEGKKVPVIKPVYLTEAQCKAIKQAGLLEANNLPALVKGVSALSTNKFIPIARQDTIFDTLQSYGLKPYINKMQNVVCPVDSMQDGAALMQDIYQKFGVKSSVVITYEGLTKVYIDPKTPIDQKIALAYAKAVGLPPPNPRKYLA